MGKRCRSTLKHPALIYLVHFGLSRQVVQLAIAISTSRRTGKSRKSGKLVIKRPRLEYALYCTGFVLYSLENSQTLPAVGVALPLFVWKGLRVSLWTFSTTGPFPTAGLLLRSICTRIYSWWLLMYLPDSSHHLVKSTIYHRAHAASRSLLPARSMRII